MVKDEKVLALRKSGKTGIPDFAKRYDRVTTSVSIFNEQLSLEEYNEWVIRNNYSKQVPQECQDAGTESTQFSGKFYGLGAHAIYNDSSRCRSVTTTVFLTYKELNDENWPVFQHFARLLIDPFIYIRCLELTPPTAVLNLLAGAMIPDFNRLQCNILVVNLEDNMQKLMSWIKERVLCKEFRIYDSSMNNGRHEEALLELFMTGAECTSEINIRNYDVSKVVFDLVKKFMDIKNCDEFNVVQSIECNAAERKAVEEFKRKHAKFIVKEENENGISMHTFEFINNDVGKKLQLIITSLSHRNPYFSLNIDNL
ncbi:hypothetical protein Ddc_20942 [Ditylenchus destructor]|nr:hypothetical protein Ddc_20942 [Ditylenchus destructor]